MKIPISDFSRMQKHFLLKKSGLSIYAGIKKNEFPQIYEEINRIASKRFKINNSYDQFDETYKYLVCISEKDQELFEVEIEIVSFYRYILCKDTFKNGRFHLSTNNFYDYSMRFETILPFTMELGRSVVNNESLHQGDGLQAIWCGLNSLINYFSERESITLLFGEVSLQKKIYNLDNFWGNTAFYNIVPMCITNFGHNDLISPKKKFWEDTFLRTLAKEEGFVGNYEQDSPLLRKRLNSIGMPIPQLIFHYANMVEQGGLTIYPHVNNELLDCWEMGMLLHIPSIKKGKLKWFTQKYNKHACV